MKTIINESIARDTAGMLLRCGAVVINTKKPFRYVSGMYSPMYTDNRLLMSHPIAWHRVLLHFSRILGDLIREENIQILSGTATAAIPHTAALAYRLNMPMIYVRSAKKDHGKGNQIEGLLKKGDKAVVIEDLISTGGSVATNVTAVRDNGGNVRHCVAITTSTTDSFRLTMKQLRITLVTLTDVATTLKEAVRGNYISLEQKKIVETFLSDPPHWGAAMGFTPS